MERVGITKVCGCAWVRWCPHAERDGRSSDGCRVFSRRCALVDYDDVILRYSFKYVYICTYQVFRWALVVGFGLILQTLSALDCLWSAMISRVVSTSVLNRFISGGLVSRSNDFILRPHVFRLMMMLWQEPIAGSQHKVVLSLKNLTIAYGVLRTEQLLH